MECGAKQYSPLQRRFLRCSSQATVTHLKKFIALKVLNSIDAYRDVDILCNDELLGKDHTLKFVILTRWRFKQAPLTLVYRPRMDLMWKDGLLIIFDLILKNQWPCFLFSPICNTVNFDCGCSFCTIYWVTRYNKWHKCYILWRILTVFSQKKFRLYPDLMFPFCFENSQ